MKNKTYIKLNNVIFPVWLIWLFPLTWIVILPANFIIDSIVVLVALKLLKINEYKRVYKKVIFKVWIVGFLADFIGTVVMFLPNIIDSSLNYNTPAGEWWYKNITNAVSYNPFQTVYSFLWVTAAVIITALFIYLFNLKISFRRIGMEMSEKKKLALSLAIITAPYLFYLPTRWFY